MGQESKPKLSTSVENESVIPSSGSRLYNPPSHSKIRSHDDDGIFGDGDNGGGRGYGGRVRDRDVNDKWKRNSNVWGGEGRVRGTFGGYSDRNYGRECNDDEYSKDYGNWRRREGGGGCYAGCGSYNDQVAYGGAGGGCRDDNLGGGGYGDRNRGDGVYRDCGRGSDGYACRSGDYGDRTTAGYYTPPEIRGGVNNERMLIPSILQNSSSNIKTKYLGSGGYRNRDFARGGYGVPNRGDGVYSDYDRGNNGHGNHGSGFGDRTTAGYYAPPEIRGGVNNKRIPIPPILQNSSSNIKAEYLGGGGYRDRDFDRGGYGVPHRGDGVYRDCDRGNNGHGYHGSSFGDRTTAGYHAPPEIRGENSNRRRPTPSNLQNSSSNIKAEYFGGGGYRDRDFDRGGYGVPNRGDGVYRDCDRGSDGYRYHGSSFSDQTRTLIPSILQNSSSSIKTGYYNAPSWNRRNNNTNFRIYTRDFASMHNSCNAMKYKVHKPQCNCFNMKEIYAAVQSKTVIFINNNDDSDIKGKRVEEDEIVKKNENTYCCDKSNTLKEENCLNGLLVVPENKDIHRSVYMCNDTKESYFTKNQREAEMKLKNEIFYDDEMKRIKVNCAACLLQCEPNGFACVSSPELEIINSVRDLARITAEQKQELHSDHADYCITIQKSLLLTLHTSQKLSEVQESKDAIFELMKTQNIPITTESISKEIVLQHHLTSLLGLLNLERQDTTDKYWLVMVYDDTNTKKEKPCWTFNLPGGKRHLGETTIDGAIRETYEELSLVWDRKWIYDRRRHLHNVSERCNSYLLLTPPLNSENEEIEK